MGLFAPGRIYAGMTFRVPGEFFDSTETDTDPDSTSIKFKLLSPAGTETTYTYGTDSRIQKASTGNYYADIRPTEGGRWRYRWEATYNTGAVYIAGEGSFIVQDSKFSGYQSTWPSSDYA